MGFPGVLKYRSPDSSWLNLQKTLTSHSDTVSSVAISPDGRQIASGSHDNTVRIWDSETGATVGALLTGHSDRVLSVAFSPNGRQIVSGSCDNTVRIWDLETGTVVGAPLTGHSDTVWSVAFSPDGRWIVSGCSDNTVCIWDSETGATVGAPLIGHSGAVYSVAFSPDGRWIVSGSGDNTVCIWDSETGAAVGVPLTGHSDRILSVAFSPNGRQIVSGSCDNTIRIWDSETGAAAGVPLTGHSNIVSSVAISPDGRQIVSGSYDNTVRIWDSETGAAVGAPLTGHSDRVLSVAFSPNGRQIVSGSYDNTVCIWDSEIEATVAPLTGHSDRVLSVAFSPNGRQVVSGSEDNTVRIWDSETGAAVSAPLVGHSNTVSSVAISPDGRQIVSGSHDNTVRIWDSETGATVGAPLTGHSDRVLSVAFSPNGRQIVSGSCDNTVRIWDSETGATVGALLTGHSDRVLSVAFSPNGRQIVSGSCDNTVRIWDLETGTVVGAPLTGHSDTVWSVAFSPDGRWIVSGSGDNTVRIWDSATGAAVGAPLAGHSNTVSSVAISPDGRRIASASHDSTVRIWDSNTGAAIGVPLTGHGDRVLSVAFSSNGRQIVSSSEDNMVCIWDLTYILSSLHHEDNESPQMITISTMFTDGWITDLFSHQLIWVPAWLRAHFCGPPALLVITPNGVTTLDLTKFVHGKDWVKCMNIAGLVPNLSSYDDTVRMWHYEPGATVSAPLTGHSDTVSLVAILPDGMQIVSGSYDSTVHGDREWESGGQAGHAHEGGSGVDVHNALPIIDFTSPEVSVASLDQHTLSADSNSQISTAVLYSPGHSMNIQSNIQPNDIQSVETQLPDGGSISSVHSPNNAAAWIEMHYDDILPESIRAQGLGGPIAAMLSPETEALIIFGSILNDWVLAAAKLLSDVSNFTVMIRPLTEDPTPKWSVIQDTGFFNQRDAWEDMHDISIAQSPIMIPEESSEGEDDAETAESMDSSTDSDPDNLDLGTGVFRLRGGASTSDSRYNPSRSPVHNLDIRLAIQPSTDLEHQVNILSKLRFTTQPKYLDEQLEGYRPQIISWTQLSVVPKTKAILPDRSYSSVGFLVHGQYISKCDPLPSDNFMRPNQTTKVVNTDISLNTITAKLTAGPHPTGEVSFARNNGHNTAVENQNDRITPKWIVDCQHGHEFEEDGKYYEELNFSYMSTCKSKEEQHPLQVEFSMGINVDDLENPSNTAIPPTAFIIRNQTMLWVSNRSLKSQGTGIIVLTSAYISEIQAVDQLSIVEKHTIQLGNSTIKAPLTETAPTKNPENRLSLSIGMRPNQVKPGLLQRITDLVTKPRSNPMKIAQDDEIQSLPLYEFASRGWDATKHEWRMPIYPSLNHCLQQAVENSKLHTWQLTVVGSEAHNIGKSKGKQRDPGPAIIQVTNQDKVTNTLEGSEGTPPTAQIPDQVTLPGSLETTSKI
ncbi:WD40-repeat-containing domain protein [Mycena metata]|uniref:WD40-repeat-containing domain protein n=1 Tax=Mycena metata TaxID=1033252 RepID=A0AAD7I5V6_9AGAR|nr:WD40-repeat-containing domain protein [Mycena metata]